MYLLVIGVITIVDELAYSSLDQGDPGSNPDGSRDVEFQDPINPIIQRDLLKRNEELHATRIGSGGAIANGLE